MRPKYILISVAVSVALVGIPNLVLMSLGVGPTVVDGMPDYRLYIIVTAIATAAPYFLGALFGVILNVERPVLTGVTVGFLSALYSSWGMLIYVARAIGTGRNDSVLQAGLSGNLLQIIVTMLIGVSAGVIAGIAYKRFPGLHEWKAKVI